MSFRIIVNETFWPEDKDRDTPVAMVVLDHLDLAVLLTSIGEASSVAQKRSEERERQARAATPRTAAEVQADEERAGRLFAVPQPTTAQ